MLRVCDFLPEELTKKDRKLLWFDPAVRWCKKNRDSLPKDVAFEYIRAMLIPIIGEPAHSSWWGNLSTILMHEGIIKWTTKVTRTQLAGRKNGKKTFINDIVPATATLFEDYEEPAKLAA